MPRIVEFIKSYLVYNTILSSDVINIIVSYLGLRVSTEFIDKLRCRHIQVRSTWSTWGWAMGNLRPPHDDLTWIKRVIGIWPMAEQYGVEYTWQKWRRSSPMRLSIYRKSFDEVTYVIAFMIPGSDRRWRSRYPELKYEFTGTSDDEALLIMRQFADHQMKQGFVDLHNACVFIEAMRNSFVLREATVTFL